MTRGAAPDSPERRHFESSAEEHADGDAERRASGAAEQRASGDAEQRADGTEPRRGRDFALQVLPALVWALLVFVGGGADAPQPEVDFGFPFDKLQHVLAFWVMQLLAYRAFRYFTPERERVRQALLGAVVSVGLGAALEFYQLGLPHRSAELADLIADAVGAGFGFVIVGWRSTRRGGAPSSHG